MDQLIDLNGHMYEEPAGPIGWSGICGNFLSVLFIVLGSVCCPILFTVLSDHMIVYSVHFTQWFDRYPIVSSFRS